MDKPTKNEAAYSSSRKFCASLEDAQLGILLLLISAVLFSIMGTFVHLAADEDKLPSTELVFIRAVFQGSFVVAGILLSKEGDDQRWLDVHGVFGDYPKVQRVVVARGIVGSLGFVCFYYAMSSLPLGDAVAVLSLHPIITVVVAPHVLPNEHFRSIHFIAALMTVIGTLYIARPQFLFDDTSSHKEASSVGYIVGLLGSCAASSVFLLIRRAGNLKANTLQLLFSWSVFGIVMSLVVGTITTSISHWHLPSTAKAWWYILGICVFGSSAHFLMNYAGRIAPAGLASILKSTDILWSYVMQIVVFDQIPSKLTIIGVLFIVISLIMLAIHKIISNQQKKENSIATKTVTVEKQTDLIQDEETALLKHDQNNSHNEFLNEQLVPIEPINTSFPKTNYGSAVSLQPLG